MLSRELSEIHEQIIESRLNDRNDVATMLSGRALEIDDKLRNLWSCQRESQRSFRDPPRLS